MAMVDLYILHFELINGTKFMKCGNRAISVTWMAIMQKMTIGDGDIIVSGVFDEYIDSNDVAKHLHSFVY